MDLFTAKKLTAIRKHFSFSQEALAEKIGVSRQAISKWERGEASPDTDNLLMLSALYGVSIDDLLGDKTADEIIAGLTAGNENSAPENHNTVSSQTNFQENNTSAPDASGSSAGQFYSDSSREESVPDTDGSLRSLGKKLLRIPYFLAAIIVFLIIGFSSKQWHPAWMIFLTVPTYYLTAWAFLAKTKKKMLLKLPVYLYTVILYLLMGFTASLWHPMWILFLLIPAYYWYVATIKNL